MNKAELIRALDQLNVPLTHYSLEGDLLPGRIVLYNSYNDWITFYLDERGNRNEEQTFKSENDACKNIYNIFKRLEQIGGY